MHLEAPRQAKAFASNVLSHEQPLLSKLYWISAVASTAASIVAAVSLLLSWV